ncbi:hypothetical protein HPP92_014555 [Vanilla planifolia]|uniref:Uncharacterized protein n=1 Tax=Vanilla planifolia TaxID=51239 RepID=A0A835QRS1_VANPL|nr:hypothetical protein HPP92_014555 [Vanilla planifolia]
MEQRIRLLYIFYQTTREARNSSTRDVFVSSKYNTVLKYAPRLQTLNRIHYPILSVLIHSQNCGNKSIYFMMSLGNALMMESKTKICQKKIKYLTFLQNLN